MLRTIVVATENLGKLRELKAALEPHDIEVLGLNALTDRTPVEETEQTFEGNAKLKAEQYSERTEHTVLADDSGIEVDALNGAPGVRSARYGGPGLDDDGRNRHLLAELRGTPEKDRTGRFRCVLALAKQGKTLATFEGTVEGRITEEPKGPGGFGYDPLFFHEPSGCTFGEISREAKQKVSHRGQAIAAFLAALEAKTPLG